MIRVHSIVASILLLHSTADSGEVTKAQEFIDKCYATNHEFHKEIIKYRWGVETARDRKEEEPNALLYDNFLRQSKLYIIQSYSEFKRFDWKYLNDLSLKRKFFLWSDFGDDLLTQADKQLLHTAELQMKSIPSKLEIERYYPQGDESEKVNFDEMTLSLLRKYRNAEALKHYWEQWYNVAGLSVKSQFTEWIRLKNTAARTNRYQNLLEYWETVDEVPDYEGTMVALLNEIKPFFTQLHAYIRHKLHEFYSGGFDLQKPIPAHLLVWDWGVLPTKLLHVMLPYKFEQSSDSPVGHPLLNVEDTLKAKGLSGKSLVEEADKFFQTLGFDKLPTSYYDKSYFEKRKPNGVCTPNAYDFMDNNDYRVMFCGGNTEFSFESAVENVCHTEWQMAYKNQPIPFKRLPRIPLPDAVFRAMARFAKVPLRLETFRKSNTDVDVLKKQTINTLFKEALSWVFPMPFLFAFDQFRWHVITGKITPDNYNCEFWKLRTAYQGVQPPVERKNRNHFDPGVYTIALQGAQWIKHVMARLVEYDVAKGLCEAAGVKTDLILCDITGKTRAGDKLKEAMKLGNSVSWYKVMEKLTGNSKMTTEGLKKFFEPLSTWLTQYNNEHNIPRGWTPFDDLCK